MLRKNCVTTPTIEPHRNTRPTWDAMYGHRMNSPDERPTPAATMPGPTMRQALAGISGKSRTTRSGSAAVCCMSGSRSGLGILQDLTGSRKALLIRGGGRDSPALGGQPCRGRGYRSQPCMRTFNVQLLIMVLFACVAGCGSGLRVTSIQLGRSLNADGTVANQTTTFIPDDTVVSVGRHRGRRLRHDRRPVALPGACRGRAKETGVVQGRGRH